jgi:hypothetical protein
VLVVTLFGWVAEVKAQVPRQTYEGSNIGTMGLADVTVGNPHVIGPDVTFVIGPEWISGIPGRTARHVRGLLAGGVAGPGGMSARLGWANLTRSDGGTGGWSLEAVYTRAWLLQWWGARRDASYLGAGVTLRPGLLRLSAALVTDVSSPSNSLSFLLAGGFTFRQF